MNLSSISHDMQHHQSIHVSSQGNFETDQSLCPQRKDTNSHHLEKNGTFSFKNYHSRKFGINYLLDA